MGYIMPVGLVFRIGLNRVTALAGFARADINMPTGMTVLALHAIVHTAVIHRAIYISAEITAGAHQRVVKVTLRTAFLNHITLMEILGHSTRVNMAEIALTVITASVPVMRAINNLSRIGPRSSDSDIRLDVAVCAVSCVQQAINGNGSVPWSTVTTRAVVCPVAIAFVRNSNPMTVSSSRCRVPGEA